jgi:uncharacterized protein
METPQTQPRLSDLSPDECWTLAASQPVGRLAWAGAHGPTVIPVNFVVTGRQVQVRTAAYSTMAQECDDAQVAFEVDLFDAGHRTGWSVLMRGRAHLDYGDAGRTGGADGPDVWADGIRGLQVSVDVDQVTGRRIG